MRIALFIWCLLFSTPVWAEETTEPEIYNDEIDLLAPEMEPEKKLQPQKIILPSCQDETLLQQVKELLAEYNANHPVFSIYERRQRIFQLRIASAYNEEEVRGFDSKRNKVVADKLLMTKINNGLDDNEIRLCKSTEQDEKFKPIYLMIYPDSQGITAEVLNLLENPNEELKTILVL